MRIIQGKVLDGHVVLDHELPDGLSVAVLVSDDANDVAVLTADEERELAERVAEIERGEFTVYQRPEDVILDLCS